MCRGHDSCNQKAKMLKEQGSCRKANNAKSAQSVQERKNTSEGTATIGGTK